MTKKGLGKGFDVLVPAGMDVNNVTSGKHEKIYKLAVDVVVPRSNQPRKNFNEKSLNELAQSIKEHGILQPLIVVEIEQNKYSIIAGERRWRAAQIVGLKEIPAIVRDANEHQQLEIALLENVQREDLSPIEQALSIQKLHEQFGQTYNTIAQRLGKANSTILNIVRLLALPNVMLESLQAGNITEGHARTLLSLQDYPTEQNDLFNNMLVKNWTVRQAEQFVVDVKKGKSVKSAEKIPVKVSETASKLQKFLKAKTVTIQQSAKGSGKLVITYKTEGELKAIVDKILKH